MFETMFKAELKYREWLKEVEKHGLPNPTKAIFMLMDFLADTWDVLGEAARRIARLEKQCGLEDEPLPEPGQDKRGKADQSKP